MIFQVWDYAGFRFWLLPVCKCSMKLELSVEESLTFLRRDQAATNYLLEVFDSVWYAVLNYCKIADILKETCVFLKTYSFQTNIFLINSSNRIIYLFYFCIFLQISTFNSRNRYEKCQREIVLLDSS